MLNGIQHRVLFDICAAFFPRCCGVVCVLAIANGSIFNVISSTVTLTTHLHEESIDANNSFSCFPYGRIIQIHIWIAVILFHGTTTRSHSMSSNRMNQPDVFAFIVLFFFLPARWSHRVYFFVHCFAKATKYWSFIPWTVIQHISWEFISLMLVHWVCRSCYFSLSTRKTITIGYRMATQSITECS